MLGMEPETCSFLFCFANESLDSRESRLVSVRLVKLKTVNFCFFWGTLSRGLIPYRFLLLIIIDSTPMSPCDDDMRPPPKNNHEEDGMC